MVFFSLLTSLGSSQTAPKQPKSATPARPSAPSKPVVAARYPLDPICPWGRISDGKGILVRCLKEREAASLLGTPPAPGSSSASPPVGVVSPARRQKIAIRSIGEAKPDTGSLPEARPQLSKPKARYVSCVEKNGGVDGKAASVTVRFLVRERGRAEGVSVIRRRSVSEAAAKCIADVVDRRYVGYPEAPIVGVTMEFKLSAQPLVP